MSDSLVFALIVIAITAVATSPIISAVIVSYFSKHPMPRNRMCVVFSALLSYGMLTFVTAAILLLKLSATFLGPVLSMAGHSSLFELAYNIREYGELAPFALLPIASVFVPIKLSKRWAALVIAWA